MNGIEIDKGELPVTKRDYSSKAGFIVSIASSEDGSKFLMHVKIRIETGDVYNVVFPLGLLRRFKGII